MHSNILLKLCFIAFFCALSFITFGKETLNVVVGLTKPPYVIEKTQSGFELELITNVLNQLNKQPNYIFVPFGRSERMLNEHDIDIILTANKQIIGDKAYLSEPYITYQNVAISLKKNELRIDKVADLASYSLATFQSAHKVLGSEFAKSAELSPVYIQIIKQQHQLEMLFKERVEVIIMDKNIFAYMLSKYYPGEDINQLTIHKVFPESLYSAAFKSHFFRNNFNQQLEIFLNSPQHHELKKKYQLIN
ncbi:substrate-binding periplasmic protein [Thalassotalea hakodatensis]|uniref:substrate-binding periplasmic protein n=1 Tax=Thalassotalea hakodatensis TaxID=3030492 RepID=UPI002573997A|nr:transporter substrate-binding domain-containing protein [Thalassotalea hakodatensis]